MALTPVVAFARSQFPFLSNSHDALTKRKIFFENAGGSQVAASVLESSHRSLSYRNRSVVGTKEKEKAQKNISFLLGVPSIDPLSIYFGANATSLLSNLATAYVKSGALTATDEVVISGENHLANVMPWVEAAYMVGATVKWWLPFEGRQSIRSNSSKKLADLISPRTRIVAVPHASNVLGQVRCIESVTREVKEASGGHAHVVVDGVAAAPHYNPRVSESNVDWYAISCHKLFGPHLGVLYGHADTATLIDEAFKSRSPFDCSVQLPPRTIRGMLELGTVSYEACAGINGLAEYFGLLSGIGFDSHSSASTQPASQSSMSSDDRLYMEETFFHIRSELSTQNVDRAYQRIKAVESLLVEMMLDGLSRSGKVRVIQGSDEDLESVARLPVVSFIHSTIPVRDIYQNLTDEGIVCRHSFFLSTSYLADVFGFDPEDGVLRISLVHYNTLDEVAALLSVLERMPGWF